MSDFKVFIEEGRKKIFAGVVDWPGWCRWGKDEETAIQSLIEYGPRYAEVVMLAGLEFTPPTDRAAFTICERNLGNATTSFGAPDIQLKSDLEPLTEEEYHRSLKIIEASWAAFDLAVMRAQGKELRKGPRGGGRDLEKIITHTLQADGAYLKRLAQKFKFDFDDPLEVQLDQVREAARLALRAGMDGEIPEKGPRGGKVWPLRFYIRRAVWHTLDHVWEIEDRIITA